ncbi:hypothetical protein [Kordia sp.]|uniref:hypothetical protein n=1 Tax=Kordia sp. TaxID=1965332 RepID=UPI003B59D24D
MKPQKTYLKGKSVFIVSLLVIVVTALTVYFTGFHYHRSITANFYMSLGIIAAVLFLFLTYGLYKGITLKDNFPKLESFEFKNGFSKNIFTGNSSGFEIGEGIEGIIISIVVWIVFSIVLVFLLIILETVLWFSIALILAMLYWVFFRAMRLVFSKASQTQGDLGVASLYAFGYTLMYTGWIFGIVYITTIFS